MEWFYASRGETVGPVDPLTLKDLFRTGAINEETFVWNESLEDWKPLGAIVDQIDVQERVAVPEPGPVLTPVQSTAPVSQDLEICAYSGRTLPRSEMLNFGEQWIAPECKDDFLQSVMEGEESSEEFSGDNRETTLGVWLIMTQSLTIFRKSLGAILICQSIIWLPASFLDSYITYEVAADMDFAQSARLTNLIDLVFGIIATAATYGVVSRAWDGEKIGVREAMGIGLGNYFRFLGTSFLRNLLVGLSLLLLIIPALILMVRWIVALPVALDSEQGGSEALRESWELTRGNYWKIVGIQFSAFCLAGVACIPLVVPVILFEAFFEIWWADGIFLWFLQLVFSFIFVETFVLYRHLQGD